jgi:hypothetical protein
MRSLRDTCAGETRKMLGSYDEREHCFAKQELGTNQAV